MSKYFLQLVTGLFILISHLPAQVKMLSAQVHKQSLPYVIPQVGDNAKKIELHKITTRKPGAKNTSPSFIVNTSGQQCSLLKNINPLLNLQAERNIAAAVDLTWNTKDLFDKKGFEVQRSFNDTNNFTTTIFVSAYANAASKEAYKLVDVNSSIQPTYYRLKQIKLDAGFAYSNTVLVKGMPQFNLFPNPAANVLYLKLQSGKNTSVNIMVYDSKATLLLKKTTDLVQNVFNIKSINVYTLPAGVYTLKVSGTDSTLYSGKFIKQ